jgi:glycosyltransferase involved in cell wall biosynthesis
LEATRLARPGAGFGFGKCVVPLSASAMKASRVVAVLHELSLTGAPRLTLDALDAIRQEASVRIVTWEGGPLSGAARRIGPTVVLRDARLARVLPRPLATEHVSGAITGGGARLRAAEQAARLRWWKPDLVYVSSVLALPLVRMLRLERVPVVLHVHELGSALAFWESVYPGLISSVPDQYVAVSAAGAQDLVRQMGVPSEAVSVVRPYVLAPIPEPAPMSASTDRTPLIVGGAGNPSWTKGPDLWLLAARAAADRLGMDRLRFVWVGYRDNSDGLHFRAMISRLGLDDVVELVPETDRASLVVLETMAMGIPVICFSPTGGPSEEVGEAGVVIPEISPNRMADAIVDLAQSPQKRRAIGVACSERAREQFGRAASLAALTKVFDTAVTSGSRRAATAGPRRSVL